MRPAVTWPRLPRPPLTRDWDSLEMDRGTACNGRRAGDDSPEAPALLGTSRTAPDWIPTGLSRRVIGEPNGERRGSPFFTPRLRWLRGLDLNQRPLGYEPSTCRDVPNDPQRQRSLKPPADVPPLAFIGARWVQFTAKTRPTIARRTVRRSSKRMATMSESLFTRRVNEAPVSAE
jgi:hypothetical protein